MWQFASALESELQFIREWVTEERDRLSRERKEKGKGKGKKNSEEGAEGFVLSPSAWQELQATYAEEQMASDLRYYYVSNNAHLLPLSK